MPWLPRSVGLRGEILYTGANPEKVRHFHSVETNLRISPSAARQPLGQP